jgi:hypothetical protein
VIQHAVGRSELSQSEPTHPLPDAGEDKFGLLPAQPDDQLLSCDERGFVRLTHDGMEAYSAHDLRRIANQHIPSSRGVVALGGGTHLILARDRVYRYFHGQTQARSFSKVPVLGPTQVFSDPSDVNRFTLRYLRDDALHLYTLDPATQERRAQAGLDAVQLGLQPIESRLTLGEVSPLESFDGQLLTRLRDGSWLYTSSNGLMRKTQSAAASVAAPKIQSELALLLPDERLDRYWALSQSGEAALMEFSRGAPRVRRIELGGMPYAATQRVETLAAIVVEAGSAGGRNWSLKVYERERLRAVFRLPDAAGALGDRIQRALANRDLCLFPGRPWVLVGGRDGVTLFDFRARRQIFPEPGPSAAEQ